MAEPASISFPYLRAPDEQHLDDIAFGRACVTRAFRACDPDALGRAVEALARAVNADTAARLARLLAPPPQVDELLAAFGMGTRP